MTTYRYGTLLRATTDDPHPKNDVSEGDYHVKPGKHADGDSYTVLGERQVATVRFETVAVYEADRALSKQAAVAMVRDRARDDPGVDWE